MSEQIGDPGATPRKALTASAIDAMLPGARLKDDRVQGLEVRRHATGTSFMLYYRTRHGQVRRPKIGNYPTLSIAQARDIARGMLVEIAAGRDTSADARAARLEPDMDALWARCAAEHWNQNRKWDRNAAAIYAQYLRPKLGREKVSAIGYGDLHSLHSAMAKTPNMANRMIAVAAKMLTLAERWGWRPVGSNPCRLVQRYTERKRRRYAKGDEIAAVGRILDRLGEEPGNESGVAFLLVMLFSGARPTEIGRATPDMVEAAGDAGVLRIEKGKTGERHVYLPAQAMRALARLPKDREKLCGRTTVPRALWQRVLKEAEINGLWVRDLRRTFASVALSSGVSLSKVGELLGHRSAQTTKIYALLMEDEAHAAAAGVANKLESLMGTGQDGA